MGDNSWMKTWLWLGVLANLGCVTSMPVGGNESSGGTSTDESDTGDSTTATDDGDDDDDDDESSSGDDAGLELCDLTPGEPFEQFWGFGEYEPPQVGYADDGLDFLCSAEDFAVEDDVLDLTLSCTVDGAEVPTQELSLSPAPAIVVDSLDDGEVLSLHYRAQQSCPNGCYYEAGGGWLTVRDETQELVYAQINGREIASALTELFDPLSIENQPSDCAPTLDDLCPPGEEGFDIAHDVTVSLGNESVTLTNAGQAQLGPYDLVLTRAFSGQTGMCEDDAGHRGGLAMRITRSG